MVNLCLQKNGECDQECHYDEANRKSECKCLNGYEIHDKRCDGELAKQFCLGFACLSAYIS